MSVSRSVPVLFARPSFSVPTPAYTMSAADDAEPPVPEAQRRRLADTAEQAERRRTQARERQRAFRLAETEAQAQRRRTKNKERQRASRLAATEAQAQQRRAKDKESNTTNLCPHWFLISQTFWLSDILLLQFHEHKHAHSKIFRCLLTALLYSHHFLHKHACCCSACTHTGLCNTVATTCFCSPTMPCIRLVNL